ncbi:uncharacterized protein LOC132797890 [Drosophila nasuta]|uniref:uncharacterized protein LOC132797890 n=1 Tax=Drosophila nasuta TaxID=42062 RepID=UPI00295EBF4A|nr:uncharacterized protein LOC132797890 [Drosophila nasuta]
MLRRLTQPCSTYTEQYLKQRQIKQTRRNNKENNNGVGTIIYGRPSPTFIKNQIPNNRFSISFMDRLQPRSRINLVIQLRREKKTGKIVQHDLPTDRLQPRSKINSSTQKNPRCNL